VIFDTSGTLPKRGVTSRARSGIVGSGFLHGAFMLNLLRQVSKCQRQPTQDDAGQPKDSEEVMS
jgi:hypothetical protein